MVITKQVSKKSPYLQSGKGKPTTYISKNTVNDLFHFLYAMQHIAVLVYHMYAQLLFISINDRESRFRTAKLGSLDRIYFAT